jgi:CDP-glucose 4,6-dehydratase
MEFSLGQRLRKAPGPLLLTGHTGFKGAWMTFLLEHLDVPVVGYSLPAETQSLFNRVGRDGAIPEKLADIRDYETLEKFIDQHKPSTIIHMAAQPLVLNSYLRSLETFEVNVMGTANVLDIAFKKQFVDAIIVVTTDKVYMNNDSDSIFVESDPLMGKDPYSASKVGTEAVVSAWQQIAKVSGGPNVVSVRAGNVIGGGDFAKDRIIPDLIRGVMSEKPVLIRSPRSTRPWQHVLDPLAGYLMALEKSLQDIQHFQFNFGPSKMSLTVAEVVQFARLVFEDLKVEFLEVDTQNTVESKTLNLNSDLARNYLLWGPIWSQEESIIRTFKWWAALLENSGSPKRLCEEEVAEFVGKLRSFQT